MQSKKALDDNQWLIVRLFTSADGFVNSGDKTVVRARLAASLL